jgi:NAD(P)-dependent dehydrogenase (short-subunit alcohol dehydrogenase family)
MFAKDKVIIVTGGASGIGRALCQRFARDGAQAVIVADRDAAGADRVARELGARAAELDVSHEADLAALVASVEKEHGRVDLFCSNAGIAVGGSEGAPDGDWQLAWDVNLMAHVYAARACLPGMLARGSGTLLQTASAAGLLTNLGAAPYAVTKHAAVAFAEWLAATYGDLGIHVHVLCPMAVKTNMLAPGATEPALRAVLMAGAAHEPEAVAEVVVRGLASGKFWILPHPEVARFVQHKAGDIDSWLGAMQKFRKRVDGEAEAEKKPIM